MVVSRNVPFSVLYRTLQCYCIVLCKITRRIKSEIREKAEKKPFFSIIRYMISSYFCKKARLGILWLLLALCICACLGENKTASGITEDQGLANKEITVAGVSQKGPFLSGSTVQLYELDADLAQTGNNFVGKILSDKGDFSFNKIRLKSDYVYLAATGYFRNEFTGKSSVGTITLNALSDLTDRDHVNINLLTHLESDRAFKLASEGYPVTKAKAKAKKEILKAFHIDNDAQDFEDMNIFEADDNGAILLAMSLLLLRDLSEGELQAEIAEISDDISLDGVWDDSLQKAILADFAFDMDAASIRSNIEAWNFGNVPHFEKYVKRFWWFVYELGICDAEKEGSVAKVENTLSKNYGRSFQCVQENWVDYWLWDAANGNKILMEDFSPSSKEIGRVQAWTDKTDGASTSFYLGTSATDFTSALQVVEDFSSHDAVFVRDDVIKDCGGVCGTVVFGKALRKSDGFRYDSNPWVAVRLNSVMDAKQGENALHWGGICIEYESSHELNIYTYSRKPFDTIDDNRLLAVVPASEEKTLVNLPWERFSPMPWLAENIPIQNFLKDVRYVIIMVFGQPSETATFNIMKVGSFGTCGQES